MEFIDPVPKNAPPRSSTFLAGQYKCLYLPAAVGTYIFLISWIVLLCLTVSLNRPETEFEVKERNWTYWKKLKFWKKLKLLKEIEVIERNGIYRLVDAYDFGSVTSVFFYSLSLHPYYQSLFPLHIPGYHMDWGLLLVNHKRSVMAEILGWYFTMVLGQF